MRVRTVALAALAALALPGAAQAAADHTYVSGVGDDINASGPTFCSRSLPCKTFAGAISATNEGGVITPIDSAGYGAVTITKAITIDGGTHHSSVLSSGTQGIIINAGADDDVTIRNVSINGAGVGGTASCPWSGTNGIRIQRARAVTIENTVIDHVLQAGVVIENTAANGANLLLSLRHVDITSACQNGLDLTPDPAFDVDATLDDVSVTSSVTGLKVSDRTDVVLSGATFFDTTTPVSITGTGHVYDGGGNVSASPATIAFSGPAGARGGDGARAGVCRADVRGLAFSAARSRLGRAGCVIRHVSSARAPGRAGRVLRMAVRGRTVALVVSRR